MVEWNDTRVEYPEDLCIHQLIEVQAAQTPDNVALAFEDQQLTYRELDHQGNQLAHYLRSLGIGPGALVGICMERSLGMLVGLLGTLKAGAAYVPLDPTYPKERLAFMLSDAAVAAVLTQRRLVASLPDHSSPVICLDTDWEAVAHQSQESLENGATAGNLAYVIYTSGSTGKPKGVMVTHRNVVNFFTGMDRCIDHDPPGVWLAVTSISFDISVLELLWTLARGFKVVIQGESIRESDSLQRKTAVAGRKLDFSISYFASGGAEGSPDKYRLLVEGAKFADEHGFSAVWTPERHFHPFGGLYPSPSLISAALATITQRIQLRAGSVVLPLHDPIRVAEEWSVVDNLSNGRVGLSFASGWHANDFALAPQNYSDRREIMFREIETVRKLWRGQSVPVRGGADNEIEVQIFPRPVQSELPTWITTGGTTETYRRAGEIGANLLTHLLGQSIEQLAEKIQVYREAWRSSNSGSGQGHVTLMVHTFVGENLDMVRDKVREPLIEYIKTSSDLVQTLASGLGQDVRGMEDLDQTELFNQKFDRFFETRGFLGTPETCLQMVDQLKQIGVDEVACLIDFGVDFESVMSSLPYLDLLRQRSNETLASTGERYSIGAQIKRHGVTHMQCTPTMAQTLTEDPDSSEALGSLQQLFVGGEAFPTTLAEKLRALVPGEVRNMYGPTETTIWSTTHLLNGVPERVPIGEPIANTKTYILDRNLRPVPIGVPGELYIGGAGVTGGYLNRPELTAQQFVPDPFSQQADARLYKTGDLVRWLPDGNIEFLGRLDYQVKVRGHRIELGEVETTLARHPSIKDAVCVASEGAVGGPRLVAYLVANSPAHPEAGELQAYMNRLVPEYMVPSAFVMLDAFPLTPNGKIDRKSLPAPSRSRSTSDSAYVVPQGDLEKSVAKVWERVLDMENPGTQDNFFDLGGHSVLMIQMQLQLREVLGKNVALVQLYKHPTIHQLVQYLSQEPGDEPVSQMSAIHGQSRGEIRMQRTRLNR